MNNTPEVLKEKLPVVVENAGEEEELHLSLFDLVQLTTSIEMQGLDVPPDVAAELQLAAEQALTQTAEKVDKYAELLNFFGNRADMAKAELERLKSTEIERLKARIKRSESEADRLTRMALTVIAMRGSDKKGKLRPLEGVTHTLKAVKVPDSIDPNGYDESLIPERYKEVTLSTTLKMSEVADYVDKNDDGVDVIALPVEAFSPVYSVDKKLLLADLKLPCRSCGEDGIPTGKRVEQGVALDENPEGITLVDCPKCNGSGRKLIPGAKLLTGKLRLVVE